MSSSHTFVAFPVPPIAAAAALLVCAAAGPAAAQQAPSGDATPELPTVTVRGQAGEPNASLNQHEQAETGSRLGLSPRETPASVSVMSAGQMAARGIRRTQDAVTSLPGMAEAPSPGNGFSSLSARGFVGHNSVAQLVDGTRLTVGSGTVTYPFSTWPIESVQVLRGPASVLQGDGAIGAVVNYVTKKPLFGRSEREAFASVGQHGTVQGGVGLRGPISDTLAYSAYADAARSSGVRADSAYDRQNLSLALSARPSARTEATLMFDGGRNNDAAYFGTPLRDGAVPARWRNASFNVQDKKVLYKDQAWRLRLRHDLTESVQLRNETYHLRSDRYWHNVESYAWNAGTQLVDREDFIAIGHDLTQTGNRFEVQANGQVAGVPHKLVAGVDAYRTDYDHINNSPYGGSDSVHPEAVTPGLFHSPDAYGLGRRTRLDNAALFAESHWTISPRLSVLGGLRAERIRLRTQNMRTPDAPQRIRYTPVTGRLGAVWKAGDALSVYGQFATGTDPVSGALALPGGRTDFKLTRGQQWEVGLKGDAPAINGEWSVALYRIGKRNLLSRDVDNPAVVQQIGRQHSTGIELALAAEPVRGWSIDANFSLLRARYGQFMAYSGGNAIDYGGHIPTGAPQRLFNLWTGWQLHPQWHISAGLRHVGKRPVNPANSAWLPAYTTVNAALSWQPTRQSSLTLAVHNLGDKVYPLSGSASQWLLGAPRTVSLTGRIAF